MKEVRLDGKLIERTVDGVRQNLNTPNVDDGSHHSQFGGSSSKSSSVVYKDGKRIETIRIQKNGKNIVEIKVNGRLTERKINGVKQPLHDEF